MSGVMIFNCSINGLNSINGLSSLNGLSSFNGLTSTDGLNPGADEMSTAAGRMTFSYIVRCALPAERLGTTLRALERSGRLLRRRGMWWPA